MLFLSLMPLSESHIPHINILKKGKKKKRATILEKIFHTEMGVGGWKQISSTKKTCMIYWNVSQNVMHYKGIIIGSIFKILNLERIFHEYIYILHY